MATTATSTLVLALQARNDTQAAFAALSRDLSQTTEATRRAAAEQTTAVREATAQQLLELRQRTAYEAQAIREGAAGADAATRQAARARILVLRQDAEQTALLARQGADAQIRAINETRDADISAARDRAEENKLMLRAEVDAARVAASEEAAALRESAAASVGAGGGADAADERRRGLLGGLPLIGGLGEAGSGMLQMAGTLALWNVGYAAINRVSEAVGGFTSGLVTANVRMEQFNQSFAVLMGSQAGGAAATAWLTQFALKAPATLDEVMQAGETVATLGDNLKEVMPAIGNVAAAMGVELPRAAQAFADAQMGRFEMLQMTLHVTKGELVQYGLQLDAAGHVLNNSFVPAFERLAQARFGQGMTMQMDTVKGVWSNVQDAAENLQRIIGRPMFALIRKDLGDFMALLQSPGAQIAAHSLGEGLGNAFHAIGDGVRAAAPLMLSMVNTMVGAWNLAVPALRVAVGAVTQAIGTVGTFLHDKVLPFVYAALGQIITWWQQHAGQLQGVLGYMNGLLNAWGTGMGTWLAAALSILKGIWDIGWGAISGSFSLVLDVITGNWAKLGPDLNHMTTQIALGVASILEGMVETTITILYGLKDPLNSLLHGLYDLTTSWGLIIYGVFETIESRIDQTINKMIDAVNTVISHVGGARIEHVGTASIGDLVGGLKARLHTDLASDSGASGDRITQDLQMLAWASASSRHGDSLHTFIKGLSARLHTDLAPDSGAPAAQIALERTLLARAQAVETARSGQFAANEVAFGLPPDKEISFGKSLPDALADLHSWWAKNITLPVAATDSTGFVPGKKDTPDFLTLGKDAFSAWITQLKAAGGLLSSGGPMPDWLKQLMSGAGGTAWSGAGPGFQAFDPRSVSEAQQKAITAAENRFQIDLARGGITQQQGLRDIGAIVAAQRAAGATRDQQILTTLQDTKTLDEQLLAQAQKKFDFDAGVAHPSLKQLHQDELAYLRLYAQTPGITSLDVAKAKQDIDAHIKQIMGGSAAVPRGPIAPVPRYGALAGETGYGQTTVSFGGAQANPWQAMVAALREQITHLRAQLAKDDQVIALLEGGNATGSAQLGVLRSIDGHVIPGPPQPQRSAHSALKAAGSYAPVTR